MTLNMQTREPSARAKIVAKRTYSRPLPTGGFEEWEDVVGRVVKHQRWLWQRALGDKPLSAVQEDELEDLRGVLLRREGSVSGRTLWLGGTEVSKKRESSMFNCAFTKIETTHDVVDAFWLLLQGCGVGFEPIVGTLNGFTKEMKIEVVRSQRHLLEQKKGSGCNTEAHYERGGQRVWHLSVGDSAEAWAKFVGKLLAGKRAADVLVLDFTQVRPAGERLAGYGWVSSGDETFAPALERIATILNRRTGQLLSRIDILDILNHLGTTLSSRRSAEIALVPYGDAEWIDFAAAKKDFWACNACGSHHTVNGVCQECGSTDTNNHRQQSNNSLLFKSKPTQEELDGVLKMMQEAGGSEPGFINAVSAKRRANWMSGVNPCVPGNTRILTDKGYQPIGKLVGQTVNVWNGMQLSAVTPFSTGVNPLVRVVFSDGTELTCTPYHKFVLAGNVRVMAEELREGDRLEKFAMPVVDAGDTYAVDPYSQGFYSGDGTMGYDWSWVYGPKTVCVDRLIGTKSFSEVYDRWRWNHGPMLDKTFVPVNGSKVYCLEWLAGLLDSDGTVTRDINGNGLQISSVDKRFLTEVRLMLTRLGVRAKLNLMHKKQMRMLPDGKGGEANYQCQDCWRLLIGNMDTYDLLQLGLKTSRLELHMNLPQRDARRFVTVERVITDVGFEETFCFTEPLNNTGTFEGIVTGQCAEILLPNKGFCVAKDTPLIGKNGLTTIGEVVGQPTEIFNGKEWKTVVPFQTGVAEKLWRVSFGDGSYLDVSENHRFFVANRFQKEYTEVRTHELLKYVGYTLHTEPFEMTKEGGQAVADAYTIGFYVGDGNGNRIDIYNASKLNLPFCGVVSPATKPRLAMVTNLQFDWKSATELKDSLRPVFGWDYDSIIAFVSGLADADGSVANKGIRIYQANESFCRELQLLLTSVGIKSSVNFMAPKGEITNFGVRQNSVWYVQISDATKLRCRRLSVAGGKLSNKNFRQTIRSVEELSGLHPTYCFNEPETTKGVFNNSLTGQCNLVELNLAAFNNDPTGLWLAARVLARANYRQTCVNLVDGILQRAWHENNEFLRLCGVGVTGVTQWKRAGDVAMWKQLRRFVTNEAYRMADELGLPRPKAVTTVKPSGTLSKIMDTSEGVHKPLGRYIFNNVRFSKHDKEVEVLRAANYRVVDDPTSPDAYLVTLPASYEGVEFEEVGGVPVNLEPAVSQLERYKLLMENYVDHNCSVTINYSPEELPAIANWLQNNWDLYVGVSFIYRNDPTKTAKDLGYLYLPQEVVSSETFHAYVDQLKPLNATTESVETTEMLEIGVGDECATGACPIR